jgi:7,8-dihydropterin-6-yl-methyl-4-(beta-D-ribofuranosyl)aminobenzene 5'-phosphate synthase
MSGGGSGYGRYPARALDHFLNVGEIERPDGAGEAGDPSCGDVVRVTIRVEGDRVADARFRVLGCPAAVAVGSAVTELAIGRSLDDADAITDLDVSEALGGLPPEKLHCSTMAIAALRASIQDHVMRFLAKGARAGVRIAVLVEDEAEAGSGARPEHGLALLVEAHGRTVLFDAGASDLVVENAEAVGAGGALASLDAVVVSHGHYDHSGGLAAILERAPRGVPVHVGPGFFERRLHVSDAGARDIGAPFGRDELEEAGGRLVEVGRPTEILPGFVVTGGIPLCEEKTAGEAGLCRAPSADARAPAALPDDFPDEIALAARCAGGTAVMVGCAHRGLVNSVLAAREAALKREGDRVAAVVGGAHLRSADDERIERTMQALRDLGVARVALGHCTGARAEEAAARAFGAGFTGLRAGIALSL